MTTSETWHIVPKGAAAVIAIPASNEANRIEACLAALATQRDGYGAPIGADQFEILIFANNCTDRTAEIASAFAQRMQHLVRVVSEDLPPAHANAGWARKRAMDLAASRLIDGGQPDGVLLTTDADSCASPTWFSATMVALANGADCVAGYIDAQADEMMRLGPAFVHRGRLEDSYLRAVAEIYALADPRAHDPWPNHRVSSGASLAVTLAAYLAIGGLPPRPVGEDAALTQALERAGYKVRHAMDVSVTTSCRFDGKAKGGAADTMQHRHLMVDAPCDDDLEPALFVARRALCRGRLRRMIADGDATQWGWKEWLEIDQTAAAHCLAELPQGGFDGFWEAVERASPVLQRCNPLRPSDLPRQIERAGAILRSLRTARPSGPRSVLADRPDCGECVEPAAA